MYMSSYEKVGLEIFADEQEAPYMGFVRVTNEAGRTGWKKFQKPTPSKIQLKKIKTMKAEQAKLLPTEEKRLWIYFRVENSKRYSGRTADILSASPISILVERSHFLRDSFEQFRTTTELDLRREIKIHFIDEASQDAGGLIREWFSVLTEELFSPSSGLFSKTNTPELAYMINVQSEKSHHDHLEYFFFCGQILAKALFEKIPVKAYLGRHIFKRLTNCELTSDDLKYYDVELWRSINYMKTTNISADSFISTFSILQHDAQTGKDEQIELKPGGSKIWVDESNKEEFIELFTRYQLRSATERQFNEMAFGFFSLIPGEMLQVLDADELELFLCGVHDIDIQDWKENTQYRGDFTEHHHVIRWFWDILERLTKDEQEKLLQFCTGSTRAPAEGFKGLTSNNGKACAFCLESKGYAGNGTDFIVAHTCFNRLEVPIYPSIRTMEEIIRKIISTPICYQFSFE